MAGQTLAALIAAGASLLVAVFSTRTSLRTQKNLAHLNNQLQEQHAERNARRDYEYEAKKRLYTECEPILFEAMELADNFRRRVISLARGSRQGNLSPTQEGWLSTRGYFFKTTAYYLLAPATSFKILQRRLTAIDLALEPRLEFQYQLLKLAFLSYTWDHNLCKSAPELPYRPNDADHGRPARDQLLSKSPQVYRRQGLLLGITDQLADALITASDGAYHCKSLGEFWLEFDDPKSQLGQLADELVELFHGFHPDLHPVLWRVLTTQYQLLGALLRTRGLAVGDGIDLLALLPPPGDAEAKELDWSHPAHEAGIKASKDCMLIGHNYLLNRLQERLGTHG
jgi:hypothetical protein